MSAELIFAAHGASLRTLCDELGAHFDGLDAARRAAVKRGIPLPRRLQKQISQLDVAFACTSHITKAKVAEFVREIELAFASAPVGPLPSRSLHDLGPSFPAPPVLPIFLTEGN